MPPPKPAGARTRRVPSKAAISSVKAGGVIRKRKAVSKSVRKPVAALKAAQTALLAPPTIAPKSERASVILRRLLENKNKSFSVEEICEALGTSSFGVSLLAFSIPEVVPIPVPGMSAIVAAPTALLSAQMIAGKREMRLPKWLLRRKAPRKAVAAAIHSILPLLERFEKAAKPRGRWVSHPLVERLLGVFIFLLALAIALPVPGTNMPPAIAIFVTSLGMIEKDGLLICIGILIGLASMVLIGGVAFGVLSLLGGLLPA